MIQKVWMLFIVTLLVLTACTANKKEEISSSHEIASISASVDSSYSKTFHDLNLGVVFDFSLKQRQADQSWIHLWVEGYQNGKPMESFPVISLIYGLGLDQVEESNVGFALLKSEENPPRAILYSASAVSSSINLPGDFLNPAYMSAWRTALSSEELHLDFDQEILLAFYVNSELAVLPVQNLQSENTIHEIVNSHENVLLFKMKMEKEIKK